MNHPETSIKQLQQELASARQKIAELERTLRPFNHNGVMEFTIQNTLREDINSLLSLINSTEDLIWFVDCDKRILLANEIMISTFRETRQSEIEVGMTNHDFLSPDQAEYFDRIFDSVLQGKTLRLNYTAPNNREYAATVQPVKRGAEIIGVSIFARDITQIHELQEDLKVFEQIFTSAPDMIAVIDRDYRCQVINDAFLEAFAIKKKDALGAHYASIVNPDHFKENTEPNLLKAFSGEQSHTTFWYDLPERGRRFMSLTYHPLRSQELIPKHVAINARDITKQQQAIDERQRIFEVSLDMFAVITFNGQFRDTNPAWEKNLGWTSADLAGRPWLDLVVESDWDSSLAVNQRLIQGESVTSFENRYLCKDGTYRWLAWSSFPDPEQRLIYSAVRDITERHRMEEELRQLATTDPLTGASNRRHFIDKASAELKRCKRYGSKMAVLMLDVDYFKQVNDTYGHCIGDEVLKQLVHCCHQELRTNDIFGRFGGEEFAAVLVESHQETALQTCERLSQQISKLKIRSGREQVSITVSIGLAMHSTADTSIDSLLKRADDALYSAKNSGRNQIVML